MIRRYPIRFLISVVCSIGVHVAAAYAMLMVIPANPPAELIRTISVTLVPESSIPGTGVQLDEQTSDTGSQLTAPMPVPVIPDDQSDASSAIETASVDLDHAPQTEITADPYLVPIQQQSEDDSTSAQRVPKDTSSPTNFLVIQSDTDVDSLLDTTDAKSDLTQQYFTNETMDSSGHDAVMTSQHTETDVQEILSEGVTTTAFSELPQLPAGDTADEFEVRLAYMEVNASQTNAVSSVDSPPAIREDLKVASVAKTDLPQTPPEQEIRNQAQTTIPNPIPQAHLELSESVNPTTKQSARSMVASKPANSSSDNRTHSTQPDEFELASVQPPSQTSSLKEETYVAPRFGVTGLSNPAPRYPYRARANNEEGKVVLRVHVDLHGNPSRVETHTSSGYRRLDNAAKKAVQKWKFQPAQAAGVVTEGVALVPVTFVLTQ